jgi:hypothetical protein
MEQELDTDASGLMIRPRHTRQAQSYLSAAARLTLLHDGSNGAAAHPTQPPADTGRHTPQLGGRGPRSRRSSAMPASSSAALASSVRRMRGVMDPDTLADAGRRAAGAEEPDAAEVAEGGAGGERGGAAGLQVTDASGPGGRSRQRAEGSSKGAAGAAETWLEEGKEKWPGRSECPREEWW